MTVRGKVRSIIGMPPILLFVEVYLAITILRNLNIFGVSSFMLLGETDIQLFIRLGASIVISAISSVLAVKTMFGLPSSNRYSWRSTVRTTVFLVLSNLYYEYYGETFMNISSLDQVLILSAVSLLIMMLPSVRAYYVAPMYESPRLLWWLKFCLLKPNDRHHRYEFSDSADSPAVEKYSESEGPDRVL